MVGEARDGTEGNPGRFDQNTCLKNCQTIKNNKINFKSAIFSMRRPFGTMPQKCYHK